MTIFSEGASYLHTVEYISFGVRYKGCIYHKTHVYPPLRPGKKSLKVPAGENRTYVAVWSFDTCRATVKYIIIISNSSMYSYGTFPADVFD